MFRKLRLWLCSKGIHWAKWTAVSHDGASVHAICNLCGYEGMVDSQGNLF